MSCVLFDGFAYFPSSSIGVPPCLTRWCFSSASRNGDVLMKTIVPSEMDLEIMARLLVIKGEIWGVVKLIERMGAQVGIKDLDGCTVEQWQADIAKAAVKRLLLDQEMVNPALAAELLKKIDSSVGENGLFEAEP
jgi:hypothetical protein